MEDTLNLVLNKMPEYFSSKYFCRTLRKAKYPQVYIEQNKPNDFLKKHCDLISRGQWKKPMPNVKIPDQLNFTEKIPELTSANETLHFTESLCIKYLKQHGYNISKLVEF